MKMALAVLDARALVLLAAVVTTTGNMRLTAKQYYAMPPLFRLDDYDACTAAGGAYCLGSFVLRASTPAAHALFKQMQKYSEQENSFNHTLLHRGYCVTSRCAGGSGPPAKRFQRCVAERAVQRYGLDARLIQLDYCHRGIPRSKPLDAADVTFAAVVALLVLFNAVGTAYDVLRNKDKKPNKYLLSWSVRANFHRLTATHDGDPRLSTLKSVQGIRAFCLALVMLAHSVIAHHMAYLLNPEHIEKNHDHWMATLLHNGSLVVQTFFMLSSFLFVYNLLLVANREKKELSLRMLPLCILHRVIRILPLHLFMVGLAATWWPRLSGGALWAPLLARQAAACARKWWTHALFLNNLLYTDEKCLLQSWFLAVDMQVYIVVAVLALLLARRRAAVPALAGLVAAAAALNFCLAYQFDLKPIMKLMSPEIIRAQYAGERSFAWLYAAPWGSLPAGLLGAMLACLHARLPPHMLAQASTPWVRVVRLASRLVVPALLLWVLAGAAARGGGRAGLALYAALDRPVFALIAGVGFLGFANNVPGMWKSFFEWSGWRVLGRMSLAVYLVHWHHHLTHLALRNQASRVSVYEIGGHWHSVQVMSYVTALPLHLCVEVPVQRFLQAALFGK